MTPPPSLVQVAEQLQRQLTMSCQDSWSDEQKWNHWVTGIASALTTAIQQERERCISAVKTLDPLKAIADWENSDDIAYAVKKLIVTALSRTPPEAGG